MSSTQQFHIVGVDHLEDDKIVVEFSDNTQATFTIDQLLSLAPDRTPSSD